MEDPICTLNQEHPRFSIRWLKIALVQMDSTCKPIQILPTAFTDVFEKQPLYSTYSTPRPRNGQQRACTAPRSLPSFHHLVIWPLRRAFHTTTPSSSPHRHALSLTRAPHPLLLRARAPHPPLFLLPALPLSLAASAPFFAPLPPPIRTPCKSSCTDVRFFPPCVSRPSPFPPPAPAKVFTHLLFIS